MGVAEFDKNISCIHMSILSVGVEGVGATTGRWSGLRFAGVY